MTTAVPCRCGCGTTDRATKIGHAKRGQRYSDEARARMSVSAKKRCADGSPLTLADARVRALSGKRHPPDCGHCAAIRGDLNGRWNGGSSQKDVRRRLASHGGKFDPTVTRRAVLDRDAWTCQLCGDPIPDLVWINDEWQSDYGTVDHIRLLSERGDHTWDNVRAAHLRCNSERWYLSRRELTA